MRFKAASTLFPDLGSQTAQYDRTWPGHSQARPAADAAKESAAYIGSVTFRPISITASRIDRSGFRIIRKRASPRTGSLVMPIF